jgi:DNA-binding Xre family transcriptional regulator
VPRTPNQIMLELIQKQETRVKELKQELSIQEKELQRMKKAQAAYEAN